MAAKKYGKKTLSVDIPAELHNTIKRIAANSGLSLTTIVCDYIKWLQKQDQRNPKFIHVQTKKTDFTIPANDCDEFH